MRQKLPNSKGYAESPEFLPALGLRRSLSLQLEIPSLLDTIFFVHTHINIYIYVDTKPITLPCSVAHTGNKATLGTSDHISQQPSLTNIMIVTDINSRKVTESVQTVLIVRHYVTMMFSLFNLKIFNWSKSNKKIPITPS